MGSISVPIYATTNRIYRPNPSTGNKELKSEHPQFTLTYYDGSRRVKRKFADLEAAKKEGELGSAIPSACRQRQSAKRSTN